MKGLLVGGGLLDLATLHPLLTLLIVLATAFALRAAVRAARR